MEERKLPFETKSYSVYRQCCHFDANYNANHFKGNKHRAGCVYYKGKCLYGNRDDNTFEEIPTRQVYSTGFLHSWCETKDGTIVDWVINSTLKIPSSEKVEWTFDELKELGFEYKPYIHEKGILKKINSSFGCNKKKKGNKEDWIKYDTNEIGLPLPMNMRRYGFDYSCSCIWSQRFWLNSRL